jgi:hypothetical protein
VTCWGLGPFDPHRDRLDNHEICAPRSDGGFERQPFPPAKRMAMDASGRICVVTSSGDVLCNATYQPPTDSVSRTLAEPENPPLVPVRGIRRLDVPKARDVVAGADHFCALAIDGTVTCWDQNAYGQAGAPTEQCVTSLIGGCKVKPTRVRLARPATAVVAGKEHSCAILDNGEVACWGNNNHGALGFSSDVHCHPFWRGFCNAVPGVVQGVDDVVALVASKSMLQTWALTDSGRIVSWPEQVPRKSESRSFVGPCDSTAGALTPEEVERREHELKDKRTRVRGRVSMTRFNDRPMGRLGRLLLHPRSPGTDDGEVIVDGKVVRFFDADSALGIYVYDACRVQHD